MGGCIVRTLEEVLAKHPPPFVNADGTPGQFEPMQIEDIHRLVEFGRALADLPVGFGKTGIGTYSALMLDPDVTLIIMPPILLVQWRKWLESIPGAGLVIPYTGAPKERKQLPILKAKWILASYGMYRNDFEYLSKTLQNKIVLVIVEEAQEMKNHNSKLYDCVKQMSEGRNLLQLSGTPASWPGDLYSYIKLHTPECYRTNAQFEAIHVAKRDFFDKPTEWRELDLMQENFSRRRVYRTKEQVHSNLPKANYIPIVYDLDPEHMALYKRLMTEQLIELDDGTKIDATTAQTLYHYAQQIITSWGYFASDETKVAKVFELIDEVCNEIGLDQTADERALIGLGPASKLIMWTAYTKSTAAVQAYMDNRLREAHIGTGKNKKSKGLYAMAAYSGADSKKSIAAFLDDPLCVSLNANPKSAGAGLNPQSVCSEMSFVEVPTRTVAFTQAAGRIDRKGQRFNPNIRLFIARGTIQETLLRNLLSNDDEVVRASGTKNSIRELIFPK
jgi:SNF2 family DNA or RNA helicase